MTYLLNIVKLENTQVLTFSIMLMRLLNAWTFQERPALCKCLCGMNVTAEEMLEAMLYIVESKKSGFDPEASLTTTTTTPKPIVGWK